MKKKSPALRKIESIRAAIVRLENRARRLWNTRTLSPESWQNILANACWNRAQELRKMA